MKPILYSGVEEFLMLGVDSACPETNTHTDRQTDRQISQKTTLTRGASG